MRKLLAALTLAIFLPGLALAQTVITPPAISYNGGIYVPPIEANLGFDSGTSLPCIVGSTATCKLQTSASAGVATSTSADMSGTVTVGGTYQTVLASNVNRKGCFIQNPTTATEVLSVKVGTMATPYTIAPGASFSCTSPGGLVASDTITLTAATTAHAFAGVSQ